MKQLRIATKITNRDSFSIDKYLVEIARLPMIKEDEEAILAERIKKGDEAAMNQLINANLRFVVSVAKQYQNQGLPLNDLINEGNIGLIKAASKFDATKGFKFISYAVWLIRQSILQALVEQPRMVRLPMNKASIYSKIMNAIADFEQKNQREPSNHELSEMLHIPAGELEFLRAAMAFHLSVDTPLDDNDELSSLDMMIDKNSEEPDSELIKQSIQAELDSTLRTLSDREVEILQHYYGMNIFNQTHSLDEIGEKMGLTRERVRQLRDKALRKMRRVYDKKEATAK